MITGSHRGWQKGEPFFPNFCLPGVCNCLPVGSLETMQGHKGHRSSKWLSSEARGTQETHCVFLNILFPYQKPQRCHKEMRPVNHHICLSFLLNENFISTLLHSPHRVTISTHVTLMFASLEHRAGAESNIQLWQRFLKRNFDNDKCIDIFPS